MSAQHTKGPWLTTNSNAVVSTSNNTIAIPCNRNGEQVAIAGVLSSSVSRSEARANARLIAAAPELLAALEALRQVAVWDDDYTTREEMEKVFALADAAIAKAKGEAPT